MPSDGYDLLCRTDIGAFDATGFKFGIATEDGTAETISSSFLPYGTPVRVVVGYDFSTNVCTLWVDPSSEGDASITSTAAVTGVDAAGFSFRQSSASPDFTLTIRNLNVALAFANVNAPVAGWPVTSPSPPTPPPSDPQATSSTPGERARDSRLAGVLLSPPERPCPAPDHGLLHLVQA